MGNHRVLCASIVRTQFDGDRVAYLALARSEQDHIFIVWHACVGLVSLLAGVFFWGSAAVRRPAVAAAESVIGSYLADCMLLPCLPSGILMRTMRGASLLCRMAQNGEDV